jgi:ribosome-associated protein
MNKKVEEILEEEEISKSQIKRDAEALKDIGRQLVSLNNNQLAQIPASDTLLEGIKVAHKIANKHEALRRQLQYIGKVLRNEDMEKITAKLDILMDNNRKRTHAITHLELLTDQLIDLGDDKISDTLEMYPQLDRQKLRQLVRQANKEKALEKPEKTTKELFIYLKTLCL